MIPNLSKDMIDLMQVLRKSLSAEFNLSLKLSQPDIVEQIQQWAGKSHKKENKVLCENLEVLLNIRSLKPRQVDISLEQISPKLSKRMYRGQAIEETHDTPKPTTQAPIKAKRMYRGQVVA